MSGLKASRRHSELYVVLDTCVLLRALGDVVPYTEVRERMASKGDIVAVSKDILKEYRGKAKKEGMTPLILQRKLQELENAGKLRNIPRSKVELVRIERKPNDPKDEKFLAVAAAIRARCIISIDPHLLDLDPYECDRMQIRILRPEDYDSRPLCSHSLISLL